MGIWGYSLYSNDTACDVRDVYKKSLVECENNIDAYKKTYDACKDYVGSDEEPLFWYALAETQWRLGRLMPEVKQNALFWIKQNGGCLIWEDDVNYCEKWISTLERLRILLESPMPPEKKVLKQVEVETNPWNVGDVYAYQFRSERSKEIGAYGKYILFQKIADQKWYENSLFSRIQIFDKLFDNVPSIEVINDIKVLPIDDPRRFMPESRFGDWPLNLSAVMLLNKKRDYVRKDFILIGNMTDQQNLPRVNKTIAECNWKNMEDDWLCDYYIWWQDYKYERNGESFRVKKNI